MNHDYKIVWSNSFKQDYYHEYEYSFTQWGQAHAESFFDEVDQKIKLLSHSPFIHSQNPKMPVNIRYFNHKNGLYILYEINEDDMTIKLLGALGKNRFHEISKEIYD